MGRAPGSGRRSAFGSAGLGDVLTPARPVDWIPLFQAFRDAFEWTLDIARGLAADFPEEIEAVERVRTFMRSRIAGRLSHVRADDVLFTFGLIIGAIERDLRPVSAFRPLYVDEHWVPWERRLPGNARRPELADG
jgi:hypothetical protein